MSEAIQWGPVAVWHHRILGGLWALFGLGFIASLLCCRSWDIWKEVPAWIAALIGAAYVPAGIGFFRLRTWARRMIGGLMAVAALYFLDMMLMAGFNGDQAGVRAMLLALGMAGYTLAFILVSAAWHSQELPR